MEGEWILTRPVLAADVQPALHYEVAIQPKIVDRVEHMRQQHLRMLESLGVEYLSYLDEAQLQEIRNMVAWQQEHGNAYYRRAQASIYFLSNDETAADVERIVSSYSKIMARLQRELKQHEGKEKDCAVMHFAEWLADAPYRFALRLLPLGIDVFDTSLEEKENYLEKKKDSVTSCSFLINWGGVTMNENLYNELIERIELKDIILGDVNIVKSLTFEETSETTTVAVSFSATAPVIVDGQLWAKGKFRVRANSKETEGEESTQVFLLEFDIEARYSIKSGTEAPSQDFAKYKQELERFASHNLPINIWPYAREFVSSMTVRMGFPPLFIGVYKVIPKS